MSDPQWEKVKEIFQAALEIPPGDVRERYLKDACADDADLRNEVLVLLNSFEGFGDFLDEPLICEVAEEIVGRRESLVAGQQFGRYLIERRLGAGGAGEVFLACDTELGRLVALKILSTEFSGNPDHVRRFVQEARAASALNHPNILTIFESGKIENIRFIAAEYVEGETLRTRLRRAPMDLGEILDIIAQAATALNAAHRARIFHRDIKPENIMLRGDGIVKVLDFGLAKLVEKDSVNAASNLSNQTEFKTLPGLVMGTVAYMSPEQARGLSTDERTDVWSIGVCLSETVFGVQPFVGETVSDQIAAILKSDPEPHAADAPPELRRIIEKCLEKKVEHRYQTMDDLLFDINDLRKNASLSGESGFSFTRPTAQTVTGEIIRQNAEQTTANASNAEYIVGQLKKHKTFSLIGIFTAIVAFGLILYFSVFNSFSPAQPIHSVAVLPFSNESGDADSEYLSDGLSESLINKLSRLPQLKVASRSSAFQYKNKTTTAPEIARALGVEAIVNGRVLRRDGDLQISVELINAADNTQLWGETFRGKMSDAHTIQEEIAQNVLQKLQIKPSTAQAQNFNSPITSNGQAYQLYLNGVFYRRKNGPENIKKAIEYQNQAIAIDPNFAQAYAELAFNYYNFVAIGTVDSQTGLPPARAAVEKALSLNESLAEAHDINASLKATLYDWTGAEREIRRAIELNPNLASAYTYYSELLTEIKRFDEALIEIRRARKLDPLRINLVCNEAAILYHARRFDEAQTVYESGEPEAVNEVFALVDRARIKAAKNNFPEAVALLEKSVSTEETTRGLIYLGRIYAVTGKREQALAVLKRLKNIDSYTSPTEMAILYTALGMRERAFESLEQAFAEHDLMLPMINIELEYDTLRDDPRFSDLLRRINLKSSDSGKST